MPSDLPPEPTPQPAPPAPEPSSNPFARMVGVILSPTETMSSIVRKPDWLVPLLAIIAISLAASMIMMPKFDFEPQMRDQLARRGVTDEAQVQRSLEVAEKIAKFQPAIIVAFVPIILLVSSGVFLLAMKVFGGDGRFAQVFSVTAYAWMPQLIKSVIATAIVFPKPRMDVRAAGTLIKSNLAFLVDPAKAPAAFTFLSGLDVFTFWTLFLIVVGLAKMSGFSKTKTAFLVVPIWLVVLLAQVGLAALQGG